MSPLAPPLAASEKFWLRFTRFESVASAITCLDDYVVPTLSLGGAAIMALATWAGGLPLHDVLMYALGSGAIIVLLAKALRDKGLSWRIIAAIFVVLFGVTTVTRKWQQEPASSVAAEQSNGVEDSSKVEHLRATISALENSKRSLENEVNRLTNELSENERQIVGLRGDVESDYAKVAKYVLTNHPGHDKTRQGIVVSIGVLQGYKDAIINSDDDFKRWEQRVRYSYDCMDRLEEIFGVSLGIPEKLPPSRELKSFAAFNSQHNKLLNLLDYQIKELEKKLPITDRNP